jgi:hypothetical protein
VCHVVSCRPAHLCQAGARTHCASRKHRVLAASRVGTALGLRPSDRKTPGREKHDATRESRNPFDPHDPGLVRADGVRADGRAQAPDFDAPPGRRSRATPAIRPGDESPSAVDLVGDAAHPAAFIAHDASYLYFRYRVDGDPAGSGGFASYAWNALMQVPSGNPFQYQYELSLDGKNDTIQIWANTSASDIDFSPLFNDPSDAQLFSTSASPLARHLAVNDGSSFGGNTDYFVDFAVPLASLVDEGVIASAADLDAALFFPPAPRTRTTTTRATSPARSRRLRRSPSTRP